MADQALTIIIKADASQAQAALGQTTQSLNAMSAGAAGSTPSLAAVESLLQQIAASTAVTAAQWNGLAAQVGNTAGSVAASTGAMAAQAAVTQTRLQDLASTVRSSTDAVGVSTGGMDAAVRTATTDASGAFTGLGLASGSSAAAVVTSAGSIAASARSMQASLAGVGAAARANAAQMYGAFGSAGGLAANAATNLGKEIEGAGKHTEGFSLSTTRARTELVVLAHEMAMGNYSRFAGSMMVMAEATDALGAIMSPTGLAIGAVVGTLAAFAVAAFKGASESGHLRDEMALTGNAAGLTTASFASLSQHVATASNSTIGSAKEMTLALASTGLFGTQSLASVAQAALEFGRVSGRAADDVVTEFSKLSGGVAAWATKNNESWHFATYAQLEYIRSLEDAGQKQQAMAETGRLLQAHLAGTAQHLGVLSAALATAKQGWSSFWDAAMNLGRQDTSVDLWTKKAESLRAQIAALNTNTGRSSAGTANDSSQTPEAQAQRARLQLQLAQTEGFIQQAQAQAKAQGDKAQADQAEIENKKKLLALDQQLYGSAFSYAAKVREISQLQQAGTINQSQADAMKSRAYQDYTKGDKPKAPTQAEANMPQEVALAAISAAEKTYADELKANLATVDALRKQDAISDEEAIARKAALEQAGIANQILFDTARIAELQQQKGAEAKVAAERGDIARLQAQSLRLATQAQADADDAAFAARQKYFDATQKQLDDAAKVAQGFADQARQTQISLMSPADAAQAQMSDEIAKITQQAQNATAPLAVKLQIALDTDDAQLAGQIRAAIGKVGTDAQRAIDETKAKYVASQRPAWQSLLDGWADTNKVMKDGFDATMADVVQQGQDAFVTFVTTGKLSVKGLVQSINADLAKITFQALAGGLGNLLPQAPGAAPVAGQSQGTGTALGALLQTGLSSAGNAIGNLFGGTPAAGAPGAAAGGGTDSSGALVKAGGTLIGSATNLTQSATGLTGSAGGLGNAASTLIQSALGFILPQATQQAAGASLFEAGAQLNVAADALITAAQASSPGGSGGGGGGIFGALLSAFGGGSAAGSAAGASTLDAGVTDLAAFAARGLAFTGSSAVAFAKGGTFTNQIVRSPTYFEHRDKAGKPRLGQMGEAGPEAIVPLTAAADGAAGLGVRMVKADGSTSVLGLTRDHAGRLAVREPARGGVASPMGRRVGQRPNDYGDSAAAYALGDVFGTGGGDAAGDTSSRRGAGAAGPLAGAPWGGGAAGASGGSASAPVIHNSIVINMTGGGAGDAKTMAAMQRALQQQLDANNAKMLQDIARPGRPGYRAVRS